MSDRALLISHAVLGFAAVFAATHHAAHAVLAALGREQTRPLRRLGWIAAAAVVAQGLCGLVLYPAYRVRVRAADFDLHAPAVAQLFDFKEHVSALAIALVLGAALAGRRDEEPRWPLAAVSCTGAAFLWVATVIGLYVTARHPL
ncbi:MAG TPA: hypothetical protein VFP52_00315 [Myxococcales bacterium]|nr:hypothetical protein [Myxococcales bacterium]